MISVRTFDDLSELYRNEMKLVGPADVDPDVYGQIRRLMDSLEEESRRQRELDPHSLLCEGAIQRCRKARRVAQDVVRMRAQKMSVRAVRRAYGGADAPIDGLPAQDIELMRGIEEVVRKHLGGVSV